MWAVFRALERGWTVERAAPADEDRSVVPDAVLRRSSSCSRSAGAGRPARDVTRHAARRSSAPASATASSARCSAPTRTAVRSPRLEHGLKPAYKRIDTCAAEFESFTPYLYGTYEQECEADPTPRPKVVILGSGPNRIGQGIEFDYCCCHAAFALRDEGFETVMINCNPETVSTDYDTVDRLYFEPLTFEDVSSIIAREQEAGGDVVVRRAVRRTDAAQAGAAAPGSGHPDPRHLAGLDRPGRGSRAVRQAAVGSRDSAGAERHRHDRRRGARGGGDDRVPARRAPVVRARRPRDGDRLRHGARSIAT